MRAHQMHPNPREWLENLNREACGKMSVAAAMLGFADHTRISRLFSRHGVKWNSCRCFDYQGVTATLKDHCARFGIKTKNVAEYRRRNNLTPAQALDYYVNRMAA